MNYTINEDSEIPVYLQLYQLLRDDIVRGTYPFGTKLPSRRILAAETGVSVITVKHTMELLCDEGYIEARERSGYFAAFKLEDFQDAASPVTDLPIKQAVTVNESDFPFSVFSKTMRKVILDYNEKLLTKAPNQGCIELRIEICSYLSRSRGIYVKPDQIIVGSGAEYLYGMIAQLFGKESVIAIENPSYEKIKKVYEAMEINCEYLTLRKDGIDSNELWNSSAMILHTTPYNSFPSGVSATSSKKHEYLLWAERRGGIIVEDNYDSELTVSKKAEDSLFLMSNGRNVIYINTFSRTIASSVRIGYMVLSEDMVERYMSKLGFYSCPVPAFDQYVLAELLHNGDFERHVNRIRRKKRKELKR